MRRRMVALVAAVAASMLLVGAGSALAGGGGGGGGGLSQEAARLADLAAIKASVAKSLGVTTAQLNAAIKTSAKAQIDAAVDNDDITSAEADTLKDAIDDGTLAAMRYATTSGVAKQLGTTAAKLNEAWSAAVKTQAKARVDKALADGKITADQATQMKTRIDAGTFKFGSLGLGGPGGKHGRGGHGGPGGGFGPGGGSGGSGGTTTQSKANF